MDVILRHVSICCMLLDKRNNDKKKNGHLKCTIVRQSINPNFTGWHNELLHNVIVVLWLEMYIA